MAFLVFRFRRFFKQKLRKTNVLNGGGSQQGDLRLPGFVNPERFSRNVGVSTSKPAQTLV
jgi:hypothetical protein